MSKDKTLGKIIQLEDYSKDNLKPLVEAYLKEDDSNQSNSNDINAIADNIIDAARNGAVFNFSMNNDED